MRKEAVVEDLPNMGRSSSVRNVPGAYSNRVPTAVAQPVPITAPLRSPGHGVRQREHVWQDYLVRVHGTTDTTRMG